MTHTIEFSEENYSIISPDVAWCSKKCPACKQYHSQNFIPVIERDTTHYIVPCMMCKAEVVVVADVEFVNKLVDWFEYQQQRTDAFRKRKRTKRWEITIEKCRGFDREESLSVDIQSKTQGMNFRTVSKKEAVASIRRYVKEENIKEKDCDFFSDVATKVEMFGGQTLIGFLEGN